MGTDVRVIPRGSKLDQQVGAALIAVTLTGWAVWQAGRAVIRGIVRFAQG